MTKEGDSTDTYQNQIQKTQPMIQLERKDQCKIFRQRTGHVMLNGHKNRIDPFIPPMCRHCGYTYETVEHYLLHCANHKELRDSLLPPNFTLENCLYGNYDQLKNSIKSLKGLTTQRLESQINKQTNKQALNVHNCSI